MRKMNRFDIDKLNFLNKSDIEFYERCVLPVVKYNTIEELEDDERWSENDLCYL